MISPFAQQEVQGSGSQKDVPFFRSPFPSPKPSPQFFFLLAPFTENAIWRADYLSTPLKRMSEGSNYFQLNWRRSEKLLFQKPTILMGWGGGGGMKNRMSQDKPLPLSVYVIWKYKYHILLPTKDIQRCTPTLWVFLMKLKLWQALLMKQWSKRF